MSGELITVKARLAGVHQRIAKAIKKSGRKPGSVKLLLATKTVPAERIAEAVLAGEALIGENKIQELRDKDPIIRLLPVKRHFIGHLQSNKVKDVLKFADTIESLDRLDMAEALQKRLDRVNRTLEVMIQVNTSFEASKFGISPEDTFDFIHAMKAYPRLRITGLMTIGLFDAEPEKVRPSFMLLRLLKEEVLARDLLPAESFVELSMGMSGDLETAIEEGATIVRVGTAIFGQRIYPDSYYWNEQKPDL
jgi:PLP dependent protein